MNDDPTCICRVVLSDLSLGDECVRSGHGAEKGNLRSITGQVARLLRITQFTANVFGITFAHMI